MKKNWLLGFLTAGMYIWLWLDGGWARIFVYCTLALGVIVAPIALWAEKALKCADAKATEPQKPQN